MSENKKFKKATPVSEITRREIESLPVAYAYATDCLGRAVETVGNQPLESTVNMDNTFSPKVCRFTERFFLRSLLLNLW